jgi:Asp-tRNA(Asn)/Glu-tRNA(Gln) amidotransferase A subunit family amidase
MTRQPAASVPIGAGSTGLPLGVQLVAANAQDNLVFRGAYALECALATGG